MINSEELVISVQKDCIVFFGEKLYPPFKLDEMKKVLGEGRYMLFNPEKNIEGWVWDDLGIYGWINEEHTEMDTFSICIAPGVLNKAKGIYKGKIQIGKKNYDECKWRLDEFDENVLKKGCFELYTALPETLALNPDSLLSSEINICYEPPKPKAPKKYKKIKLSEPILEFKTFNFKLAVIEQLMYKKELLTPKFDIYEFAEEYTRRKIDVDESGYEPIKEAVKWFKDLQIPESLAGEVTKLNMDGGSSIYGQIIPFWDGEDNFFDLNKLDETELKQFPNLKEVVLMSSKPENVIPVFEKYGIEVKML